MWSGGQYCDNTRTIEVFLVNCRPECFKSLIVIVTVIHELIHWFLSRIFSDNPMKVLKLPLFNITLSAKSVANDIFDKIAYKLEIIPLVIKRMHICGKCWVDSYKETNEEDYKGLIYHNPKQLRYHVEHEHSLPWSKYSFLTDIHFLLIESMILKKIMTRIKVKRI